LADAKILNGAKKETKFNHFMQLKSHVYYST